MSYSNDRIDFLQLKTYQEELLQEQSSFLSETHPTFLNSYLNQCHDSYVVRFGAKCAMDYQAIKEQYYLLLSWMEAYLNATNGVEHQLAKDGGCVEDSLLQVYMSRFSQIPLLRYQPDFANLSFLYQSGSLANSNPSVHLTSAFHTLAIASLSPTTFSVQRLPTSKFSKAKKSPYRASSLKKDPSTGSTIDLEEELRKSPSRAQGIKETSKLTPSTHERSTLSKGISVFEKQTTSHQTTNQQETSKNIVNQFNERVNTIISDVTEHFAHSKDGTDPVADFDSKRELLNTYSTIETNVRSIWSLPAAFYIDEIYPYLEKVGITIIDGTEATLATPSVVGASVVQGVMHLGEALFDTLLLVGTTLDTIVFGLPDLIRVISGGDAKFIPRLWEGTMGFVSDQKTDHVFETFYEDHSLGRWLDEHSLIKGDGVVANLIDGVSYVAGIVVLSVLSCGIGGAASVSATGATASTAVSTSTVTTISTGLAAVAGTGKGAETAWKDGASVGEGVLYGVASGLWEGVQFWVGGKIGSFGEVGKTVGNTAVSTFRQGTKSKFLNGLSRVIMDGIDGGAEGFMQPLLQLIYKEESYSEAFEENGGMMNVLTNALVGSASSILGELVMMATVSEEPFEFNASGYPEAVQDFIEATNKMGTMSKGLKTQLEQMFFDEDSVVGVHMAGTASGFNGDGIGLKQIMEDGLRLTGHSSSGVGDQSIDLELNLALYGTDTKTTIGFVNLVQNIKRAAYYKTFDDTGAAVIVKIPKNRLNQLDQLVVQKDGISYLKPEYIEGYVFSDHGNLSNLITISKALADSFHQVSERASEKLEEFTSALKEENQVKKELSLFQVKFPFEKTDLYIPIATLETILTDATTFANFEAFANHQNLFPDFSKLDYIEGLEQYAWANKNSDFFTDVVLDRLNYLVDWKEEVLHFKFTNRTNQTNVPFVSLGDLLETNSIPVETDSKKPMTVFPISKLQAVLQEEEVYNKFLDFDEYSNEFGPFSELEYLVGLNQLIDQLVERNISFDEIIEERVFLLRKWQQRFQNIAHPVIKRGEKEFDEQVRSTFKQEISQQNELGTTLTEGQQKIVKKVNELLQKGQNVLITYNSSNQLSTQMFDYFDDLSKVTIQLYDGLGDSSGQLKPKYQKPKYEDRVTYTGYEMYHIIKRLEELQSKIDVQLPLLERAQQAYEVLATHVPVMRDFSNYQDGHKISASLRGLTSYNSLGKQGLVCAGYSSVYKELCNRIGVACDYITGKAVFDPLTGDGGRHAWNVIHIDGEDIPVDVTWKASSGNDWFGASQKFAKYHVADTNEIYQNYLPGNQSIGNTAKNINQVIEHVIETMDRKYGVGQGAIAFHKFLETGNFDLITRTDGARAELLKFSIPELKKAISSSNGTNLKSTIDHAIKVMDQKYGIGSGKMSLNQYLKTGDIRAITRSEGVRDEILKFSLEQLKNYWKNQNQ